MFSGRIAAPGDELGSAGGKENGERRLPARVVLGQLACLRRPPPGELAARFGPGAAIGPPARQPRLEILAATAQPAFLQQQCQPRRILGRAVLGAEQHHRGGGRIERQLRDFPAALGDPPFRVERGQAFERPARRRHRSGGRRIEPGEAAGIGGSPIGQRQHQRRKIGGVHFRRIIGRAPGVTGLLPQAIGDAGPLPRRATGALRGGSLARAMGHEMRGARRPVEFGAPRQAGIDHHRDPVERQRGFRDGGSEDDPAAPPCVGPDGRALLCGQDLSMKWKHDGPRQARLDPFTDPLDLADTGEESEDIARFFAPGGGDGGCDRVFHPRLRRGPEPDDPQRMGPPLAFDHPTAGSEQLREALARDRRRHDEHPQILAQHGAAFERKGEAQIAVEMAFVRFVEEHRRNPIELGIVEDGVDEDCFGHHQNAGPRRTLAVEAGEIADGFARTFAKQFGHPLGRGARRDPARRGQDHRAGAPALIEQRGRDRGGLARPGRSHQHRPRAAAQSLEHIRKHSVNGKIGHRRAS